MHLPEEAPPLKSWPFFIGDAALLVTAYLISSQAQAPLAGLPLIAVVGCVALGAIVAIVPFLLNYARRQELALIDRQREIAALAQITATSAEQISIAASSLHNIAESASRAAKLAEQLPHKMQEKINDFKTQLNEVAVTENESLAQEINTLRASETERLETALAGVRKTATDLAMIEAVTRKHLSELNESLPRFASAAEKAANDTAKTIEAARAAAEKSLVAAQTSAANTLKESLANAVAQIGGRLETLSALPVPSPTATAIASKHNNATAAHSENVLSESAATHQSSPPISIEPTAVEIAHTSPLPSAEPTKSTNTAQNQASTPVALEEKPARKRAPRKPATVDTELMLGLETSMSDFAQLSPDDTTPAVSADGLTRLLVTAYIGIGNKLYVRGDGPGLNWDRGIPLQFVSIGKWRWESADATTPVTLKIFKNDELECTSLGSVEIQPGHQQEVTASFN